MPGSIPIPRLPTPAEIDQLTAYLPLLYAPGFQPAQWAPSQLLPNGSKTLPYPQYDPQVQAFFKLAGSDPWLDYHYASKEVSKSICQPGLIENASLAEVQTILTWCIRGERFCDGHWEAVILDGTIRRLLLRLTQLNPMETRPPPMPDWETKYNTEEYLFGKRPNRFLVENLPALPTGNALCLGEGEGRNAVCLAQHGWHVTAIDLAPSAIAKTRKLARETGVNVTAIHADLNDYTITPGSWDLIACFFVHMPPEERAPLHRKVVTGLKPGGAYLLEGFSPGQLRYGDRGPRNIGQLYSLDALRRELAGLEFRIAVETERLLDDAEPELGMCAVTQVLAVKPL